ncbi:MAG: hypothetical protein OXT09_01365 [Myxococcales bacterium]|nr:hypothetical protein [Myxococcales bacterium]
MGGLDPTLARAAAAEKGAVSDFGSVRPRPLFIGKGNAEFAIGQSWGWVKVQARRLGVTEHRIGARILYPADELLEAFERVAIIRLAEAPPPPEPTLEQREAVEVAELRTVLRSVKGR